MILSRYLILFTVVLLLFQSGCNSSLNTQINTNEVNTDMQNMDLRAYNEQLNKKNIDILLEKIEEYPTDCKMSEFSLKGEYANFVATKTYIYDEDKYQSIDVDFKLKTNQKENGYDATASITFHESQLDSQEAMRNSLDDYTAPQVFPSSLSIGDFAIGGIYHITFIRGNVSVRIIGFNEIEIDSIAGEIDIQILEIITGTE